MAGETPESTNYEIPVNPTYNADIRALRDDDPAKASTILNPLILQLIENTHAIHQQTHATHLEALMALQWARQLEVTASSTSRDELQVDMTNTERYPFNNSETTVALSITRSNADYTVTADVLSSDGEVGRIVVSDKMVNGFKIKYTGSATAARLRCFVQGV